MAREVGDCATALEGGPMIGRKRLLRLLSFQFKGFGKLLSAFYTSAGSTAFRELFVGVER